METIINGLLWMSGLFGFWAVFVIALNIQYEYHPEAAIWKSARWALYACLGTLVSAAGLTAYVIHS